MIPFLIGAIAAVFCFKKVWRKYITIIAICAIIFNIKMILMFFYVAHCMWFGHDCL